jgi:hypothetical protein
MSEIELAELRRRISELEKHVENFHAHNAALEWKRMTERFHGFDAIKNDMCPCCGARVEVVRTERDVTLRAINAGHQGGR